MNRLELSGVVQRYGKRPTAFLDELGYLDESLIAVHLTDCTDEEAALIAKRGASMIVNPGSIGIIDGKAEIEVGGFFGAHGVLRL